MNKSDLIDAIAHKAGITKAASSKVIDVVLDTIIDELRKGEKVILPGFGSFEVSHRAARRGRNPQTGAEIQIKASRVAKFKVGKKLKDAVSTK